MPADLTSGDDIGAQALPKAALTDPHVLLDILGRYAFTFTSEDDLQRGIAQALDQAGQAHAREVRLSPRDRIDFLVGRVGVEVKVAGSWEAVVRQCQRYAASDRVEGLLVVTVKANHLPLPTTIAGKPLAGLFIAGRRP